MLHVVMGVTIITILASSLMCFCPPSPSIVALCFSSGTLTSRSADESIEMLKASAAALFRFFPPFCSISWMLRKILHLAGENPGTYFEKRIRIDRKRIPACLNHADLLLVLLIEFFIPSGRQSGSALPIIASLADAELFPVNPRFSLCYGRVSDILYPTIAFCSSSSGLRASVTECGSNTLSSSKLASLSSPPFCCSSQTRLYTQLILFKSRLHLTAAFFVCTISIDVTPTLLSVNMITKPTS
jgi:hypothetical protein